MLNCLVGLSSRPTAPPSIVKRPYGTGLRILAASVALALSFQLACFSKKGQTVAFSTSPVRIAFLPFNTPAGNNELAWIALAAPVMMAKVSKYTDSLEVVPLWESMPVVREASGPSRDVTPEVAASVASWLAAKWSVMGVVSPERDAVSITIDFIPAKSSLIPFRYQKTCDLDSHAGSFRESFEQFLSYLAANPLSEKARSADQSMDSLGDLAEALDREYGWYVDPTPGESAKVVSGLVRSDDRLARLLFNPSLYSVIGAARVHAPEQDTTLRGPSPEEAKKD